MAKYNQYQKSVFNKLESITDTSIHAPLVNKVRNTLQEETAIAENSEASEEENEE